MVKTLHIVLRVYERLCKSAFVVKDRTRYTAKQKATKKRGKKLKPILGIPGAEDFDAAGAEAFDAAGGGAENAEDGEGDNEV